MTIILYIIGMIWHDSRMDIQSKMYEVIEPFGYGDSNSPAFELGQIVEGYYLDNMPYLILKHVSGKMFRLPHSMTSEYLKYITNYRSLSKNRFKGVSY